MVQLSLPAFYSFIPTLNRVDACRFLHPHKLILIASIDERDWFNVPLINGEKVGVENSRIPFCSLINN